MERGRFRLALLSIHLLLRLTRPDLLSECLLRFSDEYELGRLGPTCRGLRDAAASDSLWKVGGSHGASSVCDTLMRPRREQQNTVAIAAPLGRLIPKHMLGRVIQNDTYHRCPSSGFSDKGTVAIAAPSSHTKARVPSLLFSQLPT